MKKLEFRTLEIKSIDNNSDNDELFIEGYGAVFGNVDSYDDIIVQGAFNKSLSENKGRIAFCYQHELDEPIGKIVEIKEDEKGLWLRVRISDSCDEIKTKIREGILKEMSVGFQTMIATYDENTDIRTIKEVKLWEVSLVTIAANPLAYITELKSAVERKDYIENCFDKLIDNQSNKTNKFDLLKLKSLVLDLVPSEQTHQNQEPKPTEEKSIFDNFNYIEK